MQKIVTGASSGFGALAAHEFALRGDIVYATMRETTGRNAPKVADAAAFAREYKADLRTLELDVQSRRSVDDAIAAIVAEHGRLDVVVHNAGRMALGPAEAFTTEQLLVWVSSAVADRVRAELFRRIGVEDLLHPRDTLAPAAS